MSTSRRKFMQSTAAWAGITRSLSGAGPQMPMRQLGKTGERVSILAFGGGQRFYQTRNEEDAVRFIVQAADAGITYFDTADSYNHGRSEQLFGRAFRARGGMQGLFVATKISTRDGAAVPGIVEQSLKNLKMDRVDLIHIHSLENEDDLARIEAKGGVLEALLKARDQKLTRFIGITSHDSPAAMKLALERHEFDCCQMALNAAMADMIGTIRPVTAGERSFESLALPVAQGKKHGRHRHEGFRPRRARRPARSQRTQPDLLCAHAAGHNGRRRPPHRRASGAERPSREGLPASSQDGNGTTCACPFHPQ